MTQTTGEDHERLINELRQSLAWMDLVLSNVGEGILVLSRDLQVLLVNDALARMLDKPRISLLGKHVWEVLELSRQHKTLGKEYYQEALKKNKIKSLSGGYEFSAGGKSFDIHLIITLIPNVDEIIFIIRDVTRQLKNERALLEERIALTQEQVKRQKTRENELLLQNILNGTTAVIYIKDMQGRYVMVNSKFEELFGVNNEQLKGKTDHYFNTKTAKILGKNDEKVLQSRRSMQWEVTISPKNDLRTYIHLKYPLFNIEGKPYRICGVMTEITVRKKLEESKNDFIRMVYHELNTPLTVAKLFLQTARKSVEKGETEESLRNFDKIEYQLEQIAKLTDDLLDATKMDKAELTFIKKEFDITELVKTTVESEQKKTDDHHIYLEGDPPSFMVTADRQRIGQVLHNLISNAIKYSPKGGDIRIRLKTDKKNVTVFVRDYGIGISKKHQKRIFDQFNRGSLKKNDYSGLGMGLYIASEIIKSHGGAIDVKSEEGEGSEFSFTLPLNS